MAGGSNPAIQNVSVHLDRGDRSVKFVILTQPLLRCLFLTFCDKWVFVSMNVHQVLKELRKSLFVYA